jgi:hypothetical protein
MSRLNTRLQKLEQVSGPKQRVKAVIKTVFGTSPDGPARTGHAYANILGVQAPMVVKSLDETADQFRARIDGYTARVDQILSLNDHAAAEATEVLRLDIEAANVVSKQVNTVAPQN